MNKAILTGRLIKDPESRTAGESVITKFTVAVNRQFKKDEADFINCVAFGRTAETIAQYFTKGKPIGITGNIRTGSYDAQDGTKRYTTEVVVENFEFLSGGNANNTSTEVQVNNNNDSFKQDMTPVSDEDIPF